MPQHVPPQAQPPEDSEACLPIRTLSERTGVNTVTLRAWERRYGLLTPSRTAKGHRLYRDSDVEKVKRILALIGQGLPVSQVRAQLKNPAASISTDAGGNWASYITRLRDAVARFDERALDACLSDAMALFPSTMVDREILTPTCRELRLAQEAGEADGQYAFLRQHVLMKLGARFHHANLQARGQRIVLAGLRDSGDELNLLQYALAAATAGLRTTYLDQDVALRALPNIARTTGAAAVLLFCHGPLVNDVLAMYLARVVAELDTPVFVVGPGLDAPDNPFERHHLRGLRGDAGDAIAALMRYLYPL